MGTNRIATIGLSVAVLLWIGGLAAFGKKLGLALFLSYWASGFNTAMWLAIGTSPLTTVGIALIPGSLYLLNYWAIAYSEPSTRWLIWIKDLVDRLLAAHTPNIAWYTRRPGLFIYLTALSPWPSGLFAVGVTFAKLTGYDRWITLRWLLLGNATQILIMVALFVMLRKIDFFRDNMGYLSILFWVTTLSLLLFVRIRRKSGQAGKIVPITGEFETANEEL